MCVSVSQKEEALRELLRFTQTDNKTLAVRLAIESYVRHEQTRELANHMGAVDIFNNNEIDKLELTNSS